MMNRLVKVQVNPHSPRMVNVVEVSRDTVDGTEVSTVIGVGGATLLVPTRYVRPSRDLVRQHVRTLNAPGWRDGVALARLEVVSAVDSRGELSIVRDASGEFHVIPSAGLECTGVAASDGEEL